MTLFYIPVEIWNNAVRALRRDRPRAGSYCLLLETPDGTMISADPRASWQHPWFTIPRWNGKEWEATVLPGFVNGMDPLVPGAGAEGADAELLDAPVMPLRSMRQVPGEGDPLPPFFKKMGVVNPAEGFSVDLDFGVRLQQLAETGVSPRALFACDFYLAVARATYEPQITVVDASGVSGQVVDYSASYNTDRLAAVGGRARLMLAAKFPAIRRPTFIERLLGLYQDEGEDRTLVSTVYFLSPPDVIEGPVNSQWTAFVKHNQFWNLLHAGKVVPPPRPSAPIRFFSGLAGGFGDVIINQNLSLQNELVQRVELAANMQTPEGRFWTA